MQGQSREVPIARSNPADEGMQNREAMTQTILAMMSTALLVFTVPIVLGTLTGAFDVESALLILLLDVPTVGSWWLCRRGSWQPGSYVAICFIPDSGDGKSHLEHGMMMPITVK